MLPTGKPYCVCMYPTVLNTDFISLSQLCYLIIIGALGNLNIWKLNTLLKGSHFSKCIIHLIIFMLSCYLPGIYGNIFFHIKNDCELVTTQQFSMDIIQSTKIKFLPICVYISCYLIIQIIISKISQLVS